MSEAVQTNTNEAMQPETQNVSRLLRIVRWSFACLLAGVIFFIVNSSGLVSASGTTTETGTPTTTAMKIEWVQDMKFGTFVKAATGGTVVIAPTGVRTVSNGVYVLPGTQNVWAQAQFKITKPITTSSGGDDDDHGDSDDNSNKGGKKSVSDDAIFGLFSGSTDDGDNDDGGGRGSPSTVNNCTIKVTLPTTSTSLKIYNAAGQYMTVSDFKPVLSADGQTLNVGAKLTIQQNQPRGLYQGKFYVTAICE